MGSRLSPNPECCQLRTLFSPRRNVTDTNNAMPYRLTYGSAFSGSSNLRVQTVKRACSADFDDFHHEEMMNLIQEGVWKLDLPEYPENTQNGKVENVLDTGFDFLEPSFLGIQPEPPSWPERDRILRLNFERKVNSVELPLSIRMIKKKLQLQKGFEEAGELSHCSVKKTFSSMLFIIHELQNYALQIRESLYCEDLQGAMAKLRREMDTSFLWLFQQVLSKTPSLMVYVMVLLANFSVLSMCKNNVMDVLCLTENKSKQQRSHVYVDANVNNQDELKELAEEEEMLWNSMLKEASRLQNELGTVVLDRETMHCFVAPVCVELEGDRYEEYVKTELYYKRHLQMAPYNSLLLSNYALFLYLVVHDLDRAEEYFKRSVLVEEPEAEAYSRYGDFLWLVRKDVWAAELRYLQALQADPGNAYNLSKYTSFLWNTGGADTCFPVEALDNLQL